jgi:hypothetical protein
MPAFGLKRLAIRIDRMDVLLIADIHDFNDPGLIIKD